VLLVIAALCWLPVVWLQMRLRDIAAAAAADGRELQLDYAATSATGSRSACRHC